MENDRFINDINMQMGKFQRADQAFQSSYSNVQQVKGEGFEESKDNFEVNGLTEEHKTMHLLNALSVIVNEFPALGTVIRGSFGDQIQIPSRPQSAFDRPVTSSSQRSQGQQR